MRPWPWWRRHKIISALLVVVLVAGGLAWWRPWERCGAGMSSAEDQCVGLNLDMNPFTSDPTMNALQQRIAQRNAEIAGDDYITVVVLNNMTPDPDSDSAALLNVRHGVMGAIAAQDRVNTTSVVGSQRPLVKLLLANYGTDARWQSEAVQAILDHRNEQHIVAVIGLGQSLEGTRAAASTLSANKVAVISALASADNMNRDPITNDFIERFYRITPTNVDAANAAVLYLRDINAQKVMLVRDNNSSDIYSRTLGDSFKQAYQARYGHDMPSEATFTSPSEAPVDVTRDTLLQPQFANVYGRMCLEKPDLIYFAGRGADLKAFLRAVGEGGSCSLPEVDLLTSDDASSLLGRQLPDMPGTKVNVFYTSVATADMWKNTDQTDNQTNYQAFANAFASQDLDDDLRDGYAMAHHDALLLAVGAARLVNRVQENNMLVADLINNAYACGHPLPGATGKIAFSPDSHGNPIDKALPIMQLKPDGSIEQKSLTWTNGRPFDESCH
ncbi:ABC transporter substrate-binding protein [Saccharopolyspora sp. NPDC002376]